MQTRKSISVPPEVLARFDEAVKIAGANRSKVVSDMMDEFAALCAKTPQGRRPPPPMMKTWEEIEGRLPQQGFFPAAPSRVAEGRVKYVATGKIKK
jgi:hypothetical protein